MPRYSGYRRLPPPPLPDPSTLPFPGNVIRLCGACGLRASALAPVPSQGSIPAYVMLTGEAPGAQEDEWGVPFKGMAGTELNSLLAQAGVPRETVYINNVCRCKPSNNRTPKPAEIKACAHWLDLEVELVNPRIIVAMGATAIHRFLGNDAGTVEHLHGKPVVMKVGSATRIVLPAYHPAAALHNTTLLRQLFDDFQVLRGLVSGHPISDYLVADEYPNPVYTVVDTPEKMKRMRDEVREVGECAVDTESVKGKLWSYQVSAVPGTAWFVPVEEGFRGRIPVNEWGALIIVHYYLHDINFLNIPDGNFCDSMTQAYLTGRPQGLKELSSRICGINMLSYGEVTRPGQLKLSIQYLTEAARLEWGDPPEIEEVKWDNKVGRVVTKIKHPQHISFKIKRLLADCIDKQDTDPLDRWNNKITDPERAEVEKTLGPMPESSLADIPFADAVDYASRDAQATLRVKHKMDKLIREMGLGFVLRMDLGILPMVRSMMDAGMAVDVPHLKKLSASYANRMAAKATELAVKVGHPFNPNSSPQVAKVIYGELGFTPTAFTPSKLISTDDQELKKTRSPIATGIIVYRGLLKLKSTYADGLSEKAVPDDNGVFRVHTKLGTTRVETGRLSSSDPNLQNIPTRTKEAKAIKSAFIAPEGKILGESDYAQIEMVTLAHLSGCRRLIELFNRGGDPHTEMAANIFGLPMPKYEKDTPDKAAEDRYRYPIKRLNFGIAYLIGAQGLSNQINEYIADLEMAGSPVEIEPWDEPTCQKFIDDWYQLNPEVKDFQLEMAAYARRHGFVRDLFGRLRFVPEMNCPIRSIQEAGARQAANLPVTASAQGIIKLAMGQLWRELPSTEWANNVRVLMQIHDSLIVEVDDDETVYKPYFTWMRKVMAGVVQLRVPVKADIKVGHCWSEMEKIKL